jgi:Polyketide cyclase / dehydrase and lipid transport
VLVLIGLAIVALLVLAAMRPDTFRVARSISVKASPEKIFPLIDDLHRFNTWNPYEKKDPDIKGRYSGPDSGKGAGYAWESAEVGTGSMEIVEAAPPSKVAMRLDFVKPFEAHNAVEFTLKPEGDATEVTWAMTGRVPFMAKVMHVLFNMDKMIGTDFEAGLANLKALSER